MKQTTVTEKRFDEWYEDDVSVTLRYSGGTIGGQRKPRYLLYTNTVGALCSADRKGVGSQYVGQGKLIVCVKK